MGRMPTDTENPAMVWIENEARGISNKHVVLYLIGVGLSSLVLLIPFSPEYCFFQVWLLTWLMMGLALFERVSLQIKFRPKRIGFSTSGFTIAYSRSQREVLWEEVKEIDSRSRGTRGPGPRLTPSEMVRIHMSHGAKIKIILLGNLAKHRLIWEYHNRRGVWPGLLRASSKKEFRKFHRKGLNRWGEEWEAAMVASSSQE